MDGGGQGAGLLSCVPHPSPEDETHRFSLPLLMSVPALGVLQVHVHIHNCLVHISDLSLVLSAMWMHLVQYMEMTGKICCCPCKLFYMCT